MRTRDEFIRKSKRLKINTNAVGINTNEQIFVDEHLTSSNSKLLSKALQFKRSGHLLHVWHREGKIYVRESENSPAIKIMDELHLNNVVSQEQQDEENSSDEIVNQSEAVQHKKNTFINNKDTRKNTRSKTRQATLDNYHTNQSQKSQYQNNKNKTKSK